MANGYLRGLLGEEEYEQAKQSALSNALLATGLQGLMASGPSLTPNSFGQALGQAGMAGLQTYGGAMEQAEKQGLRAREMQQSEQEQLADAQFKEMAQGLVRNGQIDYNAAMQLATMFPDRAGSALSALKAAMPPAPAAPKLAVKEIYDQEGKKTFALINEQTGDIVRQIGGSAAQAQSTVISPSVDAFMQMQFGTTNFAGLSKDQQREVLAFANAPDADKAAQLQLAQEKQAFEMPGGSQVQIPAGRQSFLGMVNQQEQPTRPSEIPPFLGMNSQRLGSPMKENEVPLIQSQGISAQNKQELLMKQPEQISSLEYTVDNLRQMRNSALSVLNHPNMSRAFGFGGEALSKLPGSTAADVRALLDPLKNQSFVSGLQAMRQASPTGGAVGNVSNAEGARFENLIRSLDQAQSPKQVQESLQKIIQFMDEAEKRVLNAYTRTYGTAPELVLREREEGMPGLLPPGVKVTPIR
jgi:hypothetical protein